MLNDASTTAESALAEKTFRRRFKAVLISPYDLGRQPFALASPAAWLKEEGVEVACLDLSLQKLDPQILADADLVAVHVGMHTATRIAVKALPRIRSLAPGAHLCVYGLYAPMNEALLRALGASTVLGGETEPALAALARRLRAGGEDAPERGAGAPLCGDAAPELSPSERGQRSGRSEPASREQPEPPSPASGAAATREREAWEREQPPGDPSWAVNAAAGAPSRPSRFAAPSPGRHLQASPAGTAPRPRDAPQVEPVVNVGRVEFRVPERSLLPPLSRYAHLILPDGTTKTVGFVEASRGCKHLCRHCPVVPVYQGRFRIVPLDVVMADVRQQIAQGAEHISFGDPDFFNGPTHALKIVRALRTEFPDLTFDATIKIEHLIRHRDLLPELKSAGCLFVVSAVESVDDRILEYLAKGHRAADFRIAVELLRQAGIAFAPTFVPFTPWTTLEGYIQLLASVAELRLAESVPPIQLALRLLVPEGSYLLRLPGFRDLLQNFDPKMLGYPWRNPDTRVDSLQRVVEDFAAKAGEQGLSRREAFERIWALAFEAAGKPAPRLPAGFEGEPIPRLSEPWYCCAEPTGEQLQEF